MNIAFYGGTFQIKSPNSCPYCHIVINPQFKWSADTTDISNEPSLITAWTCSNESCQRVFLAEYKLFDKILKFNRFFDGVPKGPNWPKPVADLICGNSINPAQPEQTRFIKTYLQSLVAENLGLDELAGMGFRKAIEYLVKDWAIQNHPEQKDSIKKSWLGPVISQFYSGELKEILERATWLGNDQSHYQRLFDDFDLSVLKELIDLIMVELDRQFKMKHYIDSIKNKKLE